MLRAIRQPRSAIEAVLAIARGHFYKRWYPLRGIRFTAGRGLRVSGRLKVRGPGVVQFGDNVHVGMTVTPFTYTADARIEVGSGVFLNGTRFGCVQHIRVGDQCIVAECRIMDTNFHSLHANRHDPDAPVRQASVELEDNVWVAVDAALLPGTRIGRDSVVAIGAICKGAYPAGVIISGNPAQVVGAVPGSDVARSPMAAEGPVLASGVTNSAQGAMVAR